MGLVTVPTAVAGATAPTTTIYDSTDPASVQVPSLAFQAVQATEIGNQVVFAPGTSRTLNNVVVSMDSWGCATGSGTTCVTPSGATFAQPITLNLYAANPDNTPGALIATVTQTVNLAYRPSADNVNCTGGKWFNAGDSTCYSGIVTDATLNLGDITVPNKVIYGVEIRTSSYGDPAIGGPLGTSTACFTSSSGCPYDSLNVALTNDPANVTVGSNALTNGIYWSTITANWYCDGGAGGTGTFRFDGGCWGETSPYTTAPFFVPAVQFNAESTCTTACYVSPTGNDSNAGAADSPFATIQHAVNTVSSGGQVLVAAGTYNENVHITQPLTLSGANATIPGTGGGRGPESVISTSNAGNDYTVQVSSPGVTVDGFTIRQTATVTCSSCAAFGVQIDPAASGATVTDNIITGMTTSGSNPGTQAGNPIGVDVSANNTATPNNVTVARNLIENITSVGTQHKSAQGIQVGDSNSTLTGTGLVISLNHITNIQGGAWGAYGVIFNRPSSGSQVVGNTIDTLNGHWSHAIGLEGNVISPVISNNAISGIAATTTDSADIFTDATNLSVASATVTNNSLGGGTSGGIGSVSTGALTAASNYWGCPSGPNTAGCSATGGTGSLNLTPWIATYTPDPAHAGQPGFWPINITAGSNTSTITSAPSVQIAVGKKVNFTVTTHGNPAATLTAVGLPAGMTFTPGTHTKAGTARLLGNPGAGGNYTFTIHANNGVGPDTTQSFTIHVLAFSSTASTTFSKSGPPTQSFTITTTGAGAGVTITAVIGSKLGGLTFHDNGNGTATISGQPLSTAKSQSVTVTAVSGAATTKQKLAVAITG